MNSNEISNPKKEVNTGINLNDKDHMDCLLSTLKSMTKNYSIALTEASNEMLYKKYFEMFQNVSNLQREVFELMFKNGWYKIEKASSDKINEKKNMLDKEYTDLE